MSCSCYEKKVYDPFMYAANVIVVFYWKNKQTNDIHVSLIFCWSMNHLAWTADRARSKTVVIKVRVMISLNIKPGLLCYKSHLRILVKFILKLVYESIVGNFWPHVSFKMKIFFISQYYPFKCQVHHFFCLFWNLIYDNLLKKEWNIHFHSSPTFSWI